MQYYSQQTKKTDEVSGELIVLGQFGVISLIDPPFPCGRFTKGYGMKWRNNEIFFDCAGEFDLCQGRLGE